MRQVGLDKRFNLLAQEAHLTRNTLLSGFDLLLKANYFQDKDGYFYSAFFQLAIGMERLLKLVVVTDYMLKNNYQTPTIKQLRNDFGHDISKLYEAVSIIAPAYLSVHRPTTKITDHDKNLIEFFSEYGTETRYFNLNEVCENKQKKSPLYQWVQIAISIYEEYTPPQIRHKAAMNVMYKLDRTGPPNIFTKELDEYGNPLTVFDCWYRQYYIQKSAPLIIWRLIQIMRPIHFLLEAMSLKASEYEVENKILNMVIPHYEDFFYFLLADKQSIKRRKRWLELFQS